MRQALNQGKTIYDLNLRVTYYARVSTDKEDQRHSLSAQVSFYESFIRQCANWSFKAGYIDEGLSGTSVKKREQFLRMIDDAERGEFDLIITKEISRFSRNTMDSIQYTQKLLRQGVGVYFQSDNINTLLPDAELRLTIMSSVAQDEVRKISERVKFGFNRAIENGVVLGSSRIWGYEKRNGRLIIQEEEAALVARIFDLYANQQMGIRSIAKLLTEEGIRNTNGNPFSFSTLRGILVNPKYKGYYCGRKSTKIDYKMDRIKTFEQKEWVVYKDHERVPPIVSEELWEKANRQLSARAKKQKAKSSTSYQNKFPYSGKIFCGIHDTPFYRGTYLTKNEIREVWQCREYVAKGLKGCKVNSLYTCDLDNVFMEILKEVGFSFSMLRDQMLTFYLACKMEDRTAKELKKLQDAQAGIARRKDRLLDLSISGAITDIEFRERNQSFNEEAARLCEQEKTLKNRIAAAPRGFSSIESLREQIERELTFEEGFSIGVVDAVLERIIVVPAEAPKKTEIQVYSRFSEEPYYFMIEKVRGKPSVCSRRYI